MFCTAIVRNGLPSRISTKPNSISLDTCASLIIHERFAAISFSVHLRSIASRPTAQAGLRYFPSLFFALRPISTRRRLASGAGTSRCAQLARNTLSARTIPIKASSWRSRRCMQADCRRYGRSFTLCLSQINRRMASGRVAIRSLRRHSSIPKALYLASAYQAFASDYAISLTYRRNR